MGLNNSHLTALCCTALCCYSVGEPAGKVCARLGHGSSRMSMNKAGGSEFRHLVLPFVSYVALGESFNLSENQ